VKPDLVSRENAISRRGFPARLSLIRRVGLGVTSDQLWVPKTRDTPVWSTVRQLFEKGQNAQNFAKAAWRRRAPLQTDIIVFTIFSVE
jgi:hypothetical protein